MSARYAIGYSWTRYRIPFRRPLVTAHGTFPYREGAIVEVTDGTGITGVGEKKRAEFGEIFAAAIAEFLETNPRITFSD